MNINPMRRWLSLVVCGSLVLDGAPPVSAAARVATPPACAEMSTQALTLKLVNWLRGPRDPNKSEVQMVEASVEPASWFGDRAKKVIVAIGLLSGLAIEGALGMNLSEKHMVLAALNLWRWTPMPYIVSPAMTVGLPMAAAWAVTRYFAAVDAGFHFSWTRALKQLALSLAGSVLIFVMAWISTPSIYGRGFHHVQRAPTKITEFVAQELNTLSADDLLKVASTNFDDVNDSLIHYDGVNALAQRLKEVSKDVDGKPLYAAHLSRKALTTLGALSYLAHDQAADLLAARLQRNVEEEVTDAYRGEPDQLLKKWDEVLTRSTKMQVYAALGKEAKWPSEAIDIRKYEKAIENLPADFRRDPKADELNAYQGKQQEIRNSSALTVPNASSDLVSRSGIPSRPFESYSAMEFFGALFGRRRKNSRASLLKNFSSAA